jgi:hypothetical protein
MEDAPVDARDAEERLTARVLARGDQPPGPWLPRRSYGERVDAVLRWPRERAAEHPDLRWLHSHWQLGETLGRPGGRGPRALVRRAVHRVVTAVLSPYLVRTTELAAAVTRVADFLARRIDELEAGERAALEALREDLADLAVELHRRLGQ